MHKSKVRDTRIEGAISKRGTRRKLIKTCLSLKLEPGNKNHRRKSADGESVRLPKTEWKGILKFGHLTVRSSAEIHWENKFGKKNSDESAKRAMNHWGKGGWNN